MSADGRKRKLLCMGVALLAAQPSGAVAAPEAVSLLTICIHSFI